MREGRYQRELRELTYELKVIPRQLLEIKLRGLKVKSAYKSLRKASARVEQAGRVCRTLPKSWKSYRPHGKYQNHYARPEVEKMHDALNRYRQARETLQMAIESYHCRYDERKKLKLRAKSLPDLIESAKQITEIELRRKVMKAEKAKGKIEKSKWQEVAPGFVVKADIFRRYVKTFKQVRPLDENSTRIDNGMFTFWPTFRNRVYLKLPCYTLQESQYVR